MRAVAPAPLGRVGLPSKGSELHSMLPSLPHTGSATTELNDCRGSIPSRLTHYGLHTLCLRFAGHLVTHARLDTATRRYFRWRGYADRSPGPRSRWSAAAS